MKKHVVMPVKKSILVKLRFIFYFLNKKPNNRLFMIIFLKIRQTVKNILLKINC